jgi:c-di-GMP-binding flagellar brake protein YcgR
MAIRYSEDRRRAPRIPVLVRVECETPQICIFGNCENISETGMLVKVRQTFDVSQAVTLRFALPQELGGKVIQTGGTVVRVQAGESMAVQFKDMRPPFREAIARYVRRSLGSAHANKRLGVFGKPD